MILSLLHCWEEFFFSPELDMDYIIRVTILLLAKKSYRPLNSVSFVLEWNSTKPKSNLFILQINIKHPPGARHCSRHRGHTARKPTFKVLLSRNTYYNDMSFTNVLLAAAVWGRGAPLGTKVSTLRMAELQNGKKPF